MQICKTSKCTGCFACKTICPQGAISIETDQLGKKIPTINVDKCIRCGLCHKVCPINSVVKMNKADSAIAAISRNERDAQASSSGGIASVIVRKVLSRKGVAFGCASIGGEISQIRIVDIDDIEKIRGSKYVYSETKNTYQEVQNDLCNGKEVVYIGTPCQIAGLKNFLRKDYEKLYTIDLICHGTPPMEYLRQHNAACVNNQDWDKVAFRGEYNFYLTIYKQQDILYRRKSSEDFYFRSFLEGLTYRDNCYNCLYARPERCSDVTLGDFWGLDRTKLNVEMQGRISLVLANTDRGKSLIECCKQEILMEELPFEMAINPKQGNLQHPSICHKDRAIFEKLYPQLGFDDAVKATTIGEDIKRECIKNRKRIPIRILKKFITLFKR